jgi:uridine phosphorylase
MKSSLPLFNHDHNAPTVFSPKSLVETVRGCKHLKQEPIPPVCVLEFDGDLTEWLISTSKVQLCRSWACFHTTMYSLEVDGFTCGIVPRTIGGPYAVLIAEQMAVLGAQVVLGLTSAGSLHSGMPVPSLVIAIRAVRDEGTSYHYLPASETVDAPSNVAQFLEMELDTLPIPVLSGSVWTTDAPYRETKKKLDVHAADGVLAVEMQTASLLAFSKAHKFPVGSVAYVTNRVGKTDESFDKGTRILEFEILKRICRAGKRFVLSSRPETSAASEIGSHNESVPA